MNSSFLNFGAQSPIIEMHLGVAHKKSHELEEKTRFYICKNALKSCSINISGSKSICNLCINRTRKAVEVFESEFKHEIKYITRKDFNKINISDIDKNKKDIIELGVKSSIASHVRTDEVDLMTKKWQKYYKNMLDSSLKLYKYFVYEIENENLRHISLFNGRFGCARPVVESFKDQNKEFTLFDIMMQRTPWIVENDMLHSLKVNKNYAIKTYLKYYKDSSDIAEEFIYKKRNQIKANDKIYTKNQKINTINFDRNNKPLISIFTSSDDEYKYIGADWSEYPIAEQLESIVNILSDNEITKNNQLVIRMHPNQAHMPEIVLNKYYELEKKYNVKLLRPNDLTDSYKLIEESNIVVNFCSTVGSEASYLGKPVIQIGPSLFRLLPICNYVSNSHEAIEMIKNNKYKIMPKRASIIYFTFLSKFSSDVPQFKRINNGEWKYLDNEIKVNTLLRFLTIPSKLKLNISKGNYKFLKDLPLFLGNYVFGKFKIK